MKFVKSVRVNDPDTLTDYISYEPIISEAQEEYQSLFYSNQWSPATNSLKSDEPSLPSSYKAEISKAVSSAIKQDGLPRPQTSTATRSNTPLDTSNVTCTRCKSKGHSVDNCTFPQWIFQKPDDITKVLKNNGKEYHWCTKCNC